jgi:heterodisulfide reductase subunit A
VDRIGVFVCHCGLNIATNVDVAALAEASMGMPGVVWAEDYKYMCSEPGQRKIAEAIAAQGLTGVVVAACSPNMHETTFRQQCAACGLNSFMCEIANIREQCSWVHSDRIAATAKAIAVTRSMVEKVRGDRALEPIKFAVRKKALVIGAGISGMQTALEIADAGHEVILVEREPHIGGRMAQLSETFPTLDCSSCILTPKTAEVGRHPRITLLTHSEVTAVDGYVGNFTVKVRRNPTDIDWAVCTGCMECMNRCPKKVPSEFDRGLGTRKAISVAFPQAVPYRPVIDRASCIYYATGKCKICERFCPTGAIRWDQKPEQVTLNVGAIVLATGYDLFDKAKVGEYGYGTYPDVVDGLQFERLLSASGPTGGQVRRPSDGKVPKEIVFIQCVGSRDQEKGMPYCSKICCMYSAKHARLYRHKVHDGQAYLFYMDIRAGGKGYEEFIQQGVEEDGLLYLRGRVSRVFPVDGKMMVWGEDTLSGKRVEIAADMVVLATAIVPRSDARSLAQMVKVGTDAYGFFSEAHPKLRPVESLTRGIYLTGAAQAPKDIPEAVAQAGSAASKVLALFSGEMLEHPPTVVDVIADLCQACGQCVPACAYGARELDEGFRLARVNEVLCQGCGACAAACPNGATVLRNASRDQLLKMVDALVEGS